MKKLLFTSLIAAGLIFGYGCKKKDTTTPPVDNTPAPLVVKQENKAFMVDFSETWCPPCGSYGGPAFDKVLDDLEGSTLCLMKAYGSSTPSALNGKYSSAMGTDYGVKGVPTFFVNQDELNKGGGVYSQFDANVNFVKSKANNFAGAAVNAGVALDKKISGNTMTVRTKSKFFTDFPAGTDYRLAVYVVEDNITATQALAVPLNGSNSDPAYKHRNLLRTGASGSYKGDAINNKGAVANNQEFDKEFTITLDPTWNQANLKVIAVIWDATNAGLPIVVNSNMVK